MTGNRGLTGTFSLWHWRLGTDFEAAVLRLLGRSLGGFVAAALVCRLPRISLNVDFKR